MPLTRVAAETLMVRRLGRTMAWWNLDGATVDGTNADVGAALGRAMLGTGDTVSDLADPTSAEVEAVASADVERLLDLTHLYLLEACLDHADVVREREGVNEQEWNGRVRELRARLDQKRLDVAARHGDGAGTLGGATLTIAYLEPDPDA